MIGVGGKALERLRTVSVAAVTTQLFKRGLRNTAPVGLAPLNGDHARLADEAFAPRYIPVREYLYVSEVFTDLHRPQRVTVERTGAGRLPVTDCRGADRAASMTFLGQKVGAGAPLMDVHPLTRLTFAEHRASSQPSAASDSSPAWEKP